MKFVTTAFIALVLMVGSAQAATLPGDLTPQQEAKLMLEAANMVAENQTAKITTTPEELEKWVSVGANLGKGFAASARELGMAANEFAKSDLGIFTMVLIAYTYIGEAVVGIIAGFFLLIVSIPVWIYFYRRTFLFDSVTYYEKGEGPNGATKHVEYANPDKHEGQKLIYIITLLVIICISFVTMFSNS